MSTYLKSSIWQASGSDGRQVIEKATGTVLTTVSIASPAKVAEAGRAASKAQKAWATASPRERAGVLLNAARIFEQNADELSLYIARETGGIIPKGQHEVKEAVAICNLSSALPMQSQGHVLPSLSGRTSFASRVPMGVIGVISPFNFPLILTIRAVAPALALGNAVLIKPDSRTPVSGGYMLAQVFKEAGLPDDLLHVLPGDAETGEAVVTDPHVSMISFTGSPGVGRRIGELAGKLLKKVSLELGGSNPLIILEDADLDVAASNAAWGAYFHQGQICMASNRILVHESIAAALTERLVVKATHLPIGDGASGQAA
jgi:benzaldehyde dehydrogenase (NAD)